MKIEKDSDVNPFGISLTKRYVSPGGESALYTPNKIRESGSVELVDYMGGDEMVERVATAGRGRKIFGRSIDSGKFINFLVNNGIYTPFRSVQLKFSVQSPISTALSLVYLPTANVNEYSLRYSAALNTSLEFKDERLSALRKASFDAYESLIADDVQMARELGRSILGTDQDTRYFLKLDLVDLANFTQQFRRITTLSPSVDRDFMIAMSKIAYQVAPQSWQALLNGGASDIDIKMPRDNEIIDPDLSPPQWERSPTRRRTVKDIENKLFEISSFLDHGQFQAVDYMGDDNALAEAARTSYGKGTKTQQDNNQLIRSLIRDAHTTPIEMAELAFEAKSPVFSDPRQAGRHRTLPWHSFMNYVPLGDKYYFPQDSEFKVQDLKNRQGRGEGMDWNTLDFAKKTLRDTFERQGELVETLRKEDFDENELRKIKGVGHYTITWRTGDPHNLARFLGLRLDKHAQMEVREYAAQIDSIMEAHTPVAYQAFHDYQLDGIRLSRMEIEQFSKVLNASQERFSKLEGSIMDSLKATGKLDDQSAVIIASTLRKIRESNIFTIDPQDLDLYKGQGWVIPVKDSEEKTLGREGAGFQGKLKRILEDN